MFHEEILNMFFSEGRVAAGATQSAPPVKKECVSVCLSLFLGTSEVIAKPVA